MTDPLTSIEAALLPGGVEPQVLAVIWATVDVERALAGIGLPGAELPDDQLLGALVRLVRPSDGDPIALLEPRTEGRIAATLARSGEGPVGRYVVAAEGLVSVVRRAAASGVALSDEEDGPFGRSRLVLAGPSSGPHLVLVDRPAGTIDR
jgi:2-polyprenyl-6-methoxyphenol hydroxylase-like FAD-dependent oxidoreductase